MNLRVRIMNLLERILGSPSSVFAGLMREVQAHACLAASQVHCSTLQSTCSDQHARIVKALELLETTHRYAPVADYTRGIIQAAISELRPNCGGEIRIQLSADSTKFSDGMRKIIDQINEAGKEPPNGPPGPVVA